MSRRFSTGRSAPMPFAQESTPLSQNPSVMPQSSVHSQAGCSAELQASPMALCLSCLGFCLGKGTVSASRNDGTQARRIASAVTPPILCFGGEAATSEGSHSLRAVCTFLH